MKENYQTEFKLHSRSVKYQKNRYKSEAIFMLEYFI